MAEIQRDALLRGMAQCHLPPHMHDGLLNYILTGRGTGHFLTAILTNDLKGACNRADDENQRRLYDYVFFLVNYAPMGCWGSVENVERWRAQGGYVGLVEATALEGRN